MKTVNYKILDTLEQDLHYTMFKKHCKQHISPVILKTKCNLARLFFYIKNVSNITILDTLIDGKNSSGLLFYALYTHKSGSTVPTRYLPLNSVYPFIQK